jgi:hypothetical protein
MKINININGNNSNAQDTPGNPALQIKFKTHVQNNTYMNLTIKIRKIFGTWHV